MGLLGACSLLSKLPHGREGTTLTIYTTMSTISRLEMSLGACVQFSYTGPKPPIPPRWMEETYELNVRNSLVVVEHQLSAWHFTEPKLLYRLLLAINNTTQFYMSPRIISNTALVEGTVIVFFLSHYLPIPKASIVQIRHPIY